MADVSLNQQAYNDTLNNIVRWPCAYDIANSELVVHPCSVHLKNMTLVHRWPAMNETPTGRLQMEATMMQRSWGGRWVRDRSLSASEFAGHAAPQGTFISQVRLRNAGAGLQERPETPRSCSSAAAACGPEPPGLADLLPSHPEGEAKDTG